MESTARFGFFFAIACAFLTGPVVAEPPVASASPAKTKVAIATSAAPAVPVPDDPLERGTPRSSVEKFFVAANEGHYAKAARYLDLSHLDPEAQARQGPKLARDLWFVLERQAKTDFTALSLNPLGNLADGLPPNRERLDRLEWSGGYIDVDLERLRDTNGLEVWKVSSRSVEEIPKLYEQFRFSVADRFLSKTTIDSILKSHFLGLSGATWLILMVWLCLWAILLFVFLMLARWLIPRMRPGVAARLVSTIYVPVVVLLVTLFLRSQIPQRLISARIADLFRAKTILIVVAVWILFRFADFAARQARARLVARDGTAGFHLIDLLRRIAKVMLVAIGLVVWLDNMGFSVSTIVASLGVIGLAVGLASKNFIEDLIGAMTLHATGVVKRNELIRFGDQHGYVEDVGLRMTTIRSRQRARITIPNATFAAMQIENLGRRDKFLFRPRLGLRYETTPDQLRLVLRELRKLFYAHPKVQNDEARVRFASFGAYSLNLDIHCYVKETKYPEYLAVAEDLNLRIMDIVAQAGTGFAFPSQTTYLERGQAPDKTLTQEAEAEVQRWREQGQLFQHQFTEEVIKELSGTITYPDSGATDGQPQSGR